jgi:hypothetical protein
VIKIWKALGTRALEAFFGIRKYSSACSQGRMGRSTSC